MLAGSVLPHLLVVRGGAVSPKRRDGGLLVGKPDHKLCEDRSCVCLALHSVREPTTVCTLRRARAREIVPDG